MVCLNQFGSVIIIVFVILLIFVYYFGYVYVIFLSIICYQCQFLQVTGFSVGGRVVDGNGMGVEGVKIIVDGHVRSIADNQGYYKLDQVLVWVNVPQLEHSLAIL